MRGKFKIIRLSEGAEKKKTFDGVMLATGHHVHPYVPQPWPGQEKFKGRILHSHSYKDHVGYEDKRVVVVGMGNSGADVAAEMGKIAGQVKIRKQRFKKIYLQI